MAKSSTRSGTSTSQQVPQQQHKGNNNKQPKVQESEGVTFFLIFTMIVLFAVCIGVAILPYNFADTFVLGGERHADKKFKTITDFYPFYLQEHSDPTNRLFHFFGTSLVILYLVCEPILIHCVLIGGGIGYIACTLFAAEKDGLFEGIALLSSFLFFALGNKVFKKAIMVLLLGYAFAWVGHFYFEHNKPATFIYPVFSLVSDFRMHIDMILGNVSGLREAQTILQPHFETVRTKAIEFIAQWQ